MPFIHILENILDRPRVNCYSWAFSALKISKKIAMCLQFTVLFVEIVNIFVLVWIYKVETSFLGSNVEFN